MHNFERFPKALGLCPIEKPFLTGEKVKPKKFAGPPQPKYPAYITAVGRL